MIPFTARPRTSLYIAFMLKKSLLLILLITAPLFAVETDGTVTGTLTVNGKKFVLAHLYARKREAWPTDAKQLGAENVEELSCGVVELLMTNEPLSNATITSILQNDYKGSKTIRGVQLIVDAGGKYKWTENFLLESGPVDTVGITQTNGGIEAGKRWTGHVECNNQFVNETRAFSVKFDAKIRPQFTIEEKAEAIPADKVADEFLHNMQGDWTVAFWRGVGCWSATGTLSVTERSSPHQFAGVFHLEAEPGGAVDEDMTITLNGSKVHFEGGKVSVPETTWTRDVFDAELRKDLMIGAMDQSMIVLKKKAAQ